ncbi:MAG: putative bifunctional diguanylate cyclase/phosphodiesterase [Candidatus Izemoplasmatales bacterium]
MSPHDVQRHLPKKEPMLSAEMATFRIFLIYIAIGVLWILGSDKLLHLIVTDPDLFLKAEIWKGWFYVFVSGLVFAWIILKRIRVYLHYLNEYTVAYEKIQQMEEDLYQAAYFHTLTKLPSRLAIKQVILDWIENSPEEPFAFVYVDLDDFKHVNETMGYEAGDAMLKGVADVLREEIQESWFLSHSAADEFLIFVPNAVDDEALITSIDSIRNKVEKMWEFGNQQFYLTISTGITHYPEDGTSYLELLQNADIALSAAKQTGKSRTVMYHPTLKNDTQRLIELTTEIRHALEREELFMEYQPIINMATKQIEGVEALVRWSHPQKGLISPMEFITLAVKYQIITSFDTYVFTNVFAQKRIWVDQGFGNLYVTINMSRKSLSSPSMLTEIEQLVHKHGIEASSIHIEITETAAISHVNLTVRTLQALKKIGFHLVMDDFGTGYSSLTYLEKLPVDVIKIDRDFIWRVAGREKNKVILKSIIELVHSLGMSVIAEGVETKEQLSVIDEYGCDAVQGFYYSRPKSPERVFKEPLGPLQKE